MGKHVSKNLTIESYVDDLTAKGERVILLNTVIVGIFVCTYFHAI